MSESSQKDAGTAIQVMLNRLDPAFAACAVLAEEGRAGECLDEVDTQFLARLFDQSRNDVSLATKHPKWQPLIVRITSLCGEITSNSSRTNRRNHEVTP
jgi:hypothetical protein